jgi:hypothetical protein
LGDLDDLLASWRDPSSDFVKILDDAVMKLLDESGYIVPETNVSSQPESAEGPKRSTGKAGAGIFGAVSVPNPPSIRVPDVKRPKSKKFTAKKSVSPSSVATLDGFVMTLQRTDVGVGQTTSGTSRRSPEIFIPLAARDYATQFWGWPDKFDEDTVKPGKWDRVDVQMRLAGKIISVNMMTWPDKHDFRLRSEPLRSAGDIDDILRMEIAGSEKPYEYYVEIIPKGSTDYPYYYSICSNPVRNSRKRFGYY